ncbi:MAG: type I glutamate--ammonia ligase [Chloroflexi bacterium]|nr:type I glutamate--ammonia ligase [Chloroflexota bacterium]
MTPQEITQFIKANDIQIVDLKFIDLPGLWQHFSVPISELTDDVYVNGLGFDGSSIRGFQKIQESDMLLIPDPTTALKDPAATVPTLSMIGDVQDPINRQWYSRDPRYIAKKAEQYVKSTGLADTVYFGPEAEFFVFDDVRYEQSSNRGYYEIDSGEAIWNSGAGGGNLGYKMRSKEGYFPVAPHDTLQDLRSEMVVELVKAGIPVEAHHHEVGGPGQCEIDMRFDTLTKMADKLMMYKYIVKNVARRHGKVVTFMPKPIFGDNGSGMHCHSSLWKNGEPLFYDANGYAKISQMCKYYIGGLLKHAPALVALVAPTTNSYKRLVPGYEAPVNLVYSARNRSAACRIPMISESPKAKRVEFRVPDPSCNPYLAFSAIMLAGLDGIINEIDPGQPMDVNTYELEGPLAGEIPTVPGSLDEALKALEADYEFLLKGDVFTMDVLETWLEFKRENEVDPMRMRPHPYEFHLYFDV